MYSITFVQEVKIDGVIIVSTPQDLALLDVKRGIQMYEKTGVKILGLIDNMSFLKVMMEKNIKFLEKVVLKKLLQNLIKNF